MTAAKNTVLTARQLTTQTAFDHVVDMLVQHLVTDVVADLSGESIHQQNPCIGLADATLTHIKHGFLVKLACGGTMRTLHVVGIDFQKRLAVDFGLGRQDLKYLQHLCLAS